MLGIIGTSGKLGYSTLTALLKHSMIPPTEIIACTSSQPNSPTWLKLSQHGVQVRHADFNNPSTFLTALSGCSKLYLVSTPQISLDYNNAPPGSGREGRHFEAIDAAIEAGVKHIYYTSLAFGRPSKAGVMRAHIRTEEYLESLAKSHPDVKYTVIREGLYNESWPLYLGYFHEKNDTREEVIVAGDGFINWTSIEDLGLGSALIITAPENRYKGKTMYLSTQRNVLSLKGVAELVSKVRGKELKVKVVGEEEYVDHYVNHRKQDRGDIEWWVSSYASLKDGETHIKDNTLDELLSEQGWTPVPMEKTIQEMVGGK